MPANAHRPGRLVEVHRFSAPLAPEKLLEQLRGVTHPTDEFQLVSKLSGAGIVVRVLQSPATKLPFHGRIENDTLAITLATRGHQMTPFQPILDGTICATHTGSQLDLTLRLPPGVPTLERAGKIAAALFVAAALPGLFSGVYTAGLLLPFAALCWIFPSLRARYSFAGDCRRSLAALAEAIPQLEPEAGSVSR